MSSKLQDSKLWHYNANTDKFKLYVYGEESVAQSAIAPKVSSARCDDTMSVADSCCSLARWSTYSGSSHRKPTAYLLQSQSSFGMS